LLDQQQIQVPRAPRVLLDVMALRALQASRGRLAQQAPQALAQPALLAQQVLLVRAPRVLLELAALVELVQRVLLVRARRALLGLAALVLQGGRERQGILGRLA
jgi:hypothetical protein